MVEPTSPPSNEAYGLIAKVLHWGTFVMLGVQFAIGYAIDRFDDVADSWPLDEDYLVPAHMLLGVGILVVTLIRLAWRRVHGLPPWAETLTQFERRLAHLTERVLYLCLFLIPVTGLLLVLITGEDWDVGGRWAWVAPLDVIDDEVVLSFHIGSHLLFFLALASHVGLVFKHQVMNRDRLLRRML